MLFDYVAEVLDGVIDGLYHELRTVVALQAQGIVLRVALWEEECLAGFLAVEVGDIDAAVVAVVTATGAHDPLAVAGPRGIALGGVLGVEEGEWVCRVVGRLWRCICHRHRDESDVGIVVPDVEASVGAFGKEDVLAIGADAWEGDAATVGVGFVDEFFVAELARLEVEGAAVEVVAHLGVIRVIVYVGHRAGIG